ncbi:uncharacterized protein LOC112556367 [Pomacea canaliculata]|uniref:uncharacterized protein LOC112556367 n=1 Tax=Pomacea canaliculata TaxID=400727 RepID=UPI000D73ADFE|nr:uncharacterized protein LOC112556367 [Pomacea canaliculata]
MNMLWWSLILVAGALPLVFCLQESMDSSKDQQQDYRLDLMAASIRQLTELAEKLDKKLKLVQTMEKRLELVEKEQKRLTEQDTIHEKLKVDVAVDRTIAGQPESHLEKRSDDTASWEPVVAQVTQRLNLAEANIEALKNSVVADQQRTGTVYVRWGNSICPGSAETVYSGIVGGSWFNDVGSATSYLCLPHDPNFGGHTIPRYGNGKLYGAEYETCDEPECDLTPSCAVCRISRESYFMLPARNTCYPGWTFEYSGYIMASYPSHSGGTEYICVDSSLNYTEGSGGDQNGAMLHYTAYVCGSLPCPPYIEHRVVVCVVCSK